MANKTFKLLADKMGGRQSSQYIGTEGEVFYDPTTTTLRISDGSTAGGISIGGNDTYGQFWSDTTRTVASPDTEYRFTFNNSDAMNSNVTLGTGGNNSRIIINQIGIYNIQFSAQIDKNPVGSSTATSTIWFKKNGTAVPYSAGFLTIDNAIQTVITWNILANVANVGDYYEIAYASDRTYVTFPAIPANATSGAPASPSIIVTVTPVGA
jgi:hypothetical protein